MIKFVIIFVSLLSYACAPGSGGGSGATHAKTLQISNDSTLQNFYSVYESNALSHGYVIDDLIIEVSSFDSSISYQQIEGIYCACIKGSNQTPRIVFENTSFNSGSRQFFAFYQMMGLCHMNKNFNSETFQQTDISTGNVKNIPYSFMYPNIQLSLWPSQSISNFTSEYSRLITYYWSNPGK